MSTFDTTFAESVEIHVVNFDSIKLEMKNITEIEEDTFNGLSDYLTINISLRLDMMKYLACLIMKMQISFQL